DPAGTNLGDGGVGLVSGARVVYQLTRCARPGTPGVPQDGADGSTAVGEVAGQVAVGEEDVPVPQDLGVGGGSHQVDLLRHRPGAAAIVRPGLLGTHRVHRGGRGADAQESVDLAAGQDGENRLLVVGVLLGCDERLRLRLPGLAAVHAAHDSGALPGVVRKGAVQRDDQFAGGELLDLPVAGRPAEVGVAAWLAHRGLHPDRVRPGGAAV